MLERAALGRTRNGHGMSDTAQGPGWWLASDGKWYPPEMWTGPPSAGPAGMAPAQPSPAYGPAASGAGRPYPAAGYAQYPPYGPGPYGPGTAATPKTNGLAVASLICSCAGLFFLPVFPGIILGFVARSQIKRSNGMQRGHGLAIAGIIVGFGWLLLITLGLVLGETNANNNSGVIAAISAVTAVRGGPAELAI
jgi:hypothetical protein